MMLQPAWRDLAIPRPSTAGLVLAAGLGTRLGRGPKAFVRLDGEPLLLRAVERLRRCGVTTVVAVLPPAPDPIALPDGLIVVRNARPESGQLGSTCLGVAALPQDVRSVIIYPVDHYAVTDHDLRLIVNAIDECESGEGRVVPRFAGRGGHPVALLPPSVDALRAVIDPMSSTLREVLDAAGPVHTVDGVSEGVRRNLNVPTDMPASGAPLARETQ